MPSDTLPAATSHRKEHDVPGLLSYAREVTSSWPDIPGVIIAEGAAVSVTMRSGMLVIKDGIAGSRRERKISKIDRSFRRLVILAADGYISLDAMHWLATREISWCQLSQTSGIQACSAPRYQDAKLLRTQARACRDGDLSAVAKEITRYLITRKIQGQLANISEYFTSPDTEVYLKERLSDVETSDTTEGIRGAEGLAASAYWQCWKGNVRVPFSKSDLGRIPDHWLVFGKRQSLAMYGERNINASDPINATLNYLYRIGEIESTHMCHALGLSPLLGTDHADKEGRNSLSLDLLEAIRPECDKIALEKLSVCGEIPCDPLGKPCYFDRRWLHENREGIVRLCPPYTHYLAGMSVKLGDKLAPHAAKVALFLADAANGHVKVYTPIKREKTERRYYPKVHLRKGTTTRQIIPDTLWESIEPVLSARPNTGRGAAPALPTRELCAAMIARYICGVPWPQTGLKQDTAQVWFKFWQSNGTWPKVKTLTEEHGHLASLTE